MTLYNYIQKCTNWEITVWDEDYDIEVYFYKPDDYNNLDLWDKSMVELSKLLEISSFENSGVTVNLSKVIERKISQLSKTDLFITCDIDEIMNGIEAIISGNVPEEWMNEFVNVLKED